LEFRYPEAGKWLRVSDGKVYRAYRSATGERRQKPASQEDLDILRGTVIAKYEGIARRVTSAKVLRREPVSVGEKPVDCYVVEVRYEPHNLLPGAQPLPTTYWVGKAHLVVLRQVSGTESQMGGHRTLDTCTITFQRVSVNETLPDSVFATDPTH
jgi:hypothetical protein